MGNKDFTCYYVDGLSAQNIVLGKRNFRQENGGLTNCIANMLTVVLGRHQLSAISGLKQVHSTSCKRPEGPEDSLILFWGNIVPVSAGLECPHHQRKL